MSATNLSGRELDGAVAKLLGWSPGFDWRRGDEVGTHAPNYSGSYALLGEMLAWLRERVRPPRRVAMMDLDGWMACVEEWNDDAEDHFIDECAVGATLSEAVARLVVAVAAKEEPNA